MTNADINARLLLYRNGTKACGCQTCRPNDNPIGGPFDCIKPVYAPPYTKQDIANLMGLPLPDQVWQGVE